MVVSADCNCQVPLRCRATDAIIGTDDSAFFRVRGIAWRDRDLAGTTEFFTDLPARVTPSVSSSGKRNRLDGNLLRFDLHLEMRVFAAHADGNHCQAGLDGLHDARRFVDQTIHKASDDRWIRSCRWHLRKHGSLSFGDAAPSFGRLHRDVAQLSDASRAINRRESPCPRVGTVLAACTQQCGRCEQEYTDFSLS